MKATWLRSVLPVGLLCLTVGGCDGQGGEASELSQAVAPIQCKLPMLNATTAAGVGRPAMGVPETLPVPASIPVSGGAADATATLDYTLPADNNRVLQCRYKRQGNELKLVNCDREVDATSWLEASSVSVSVSDPNARASLSICPIGPVIDVAAALPPAGETVQRVAQMANVRLLPADAIPGSLTAQDITKYVAAARADQRVKELLAERSAYIEHLEEGNDKGDKPGAHQIRLIFYSYSKSRTVEVSMNRAVVTKAQYVDFFPPEGKEEIDLSIELAKKDPRLAGKVADLKAGGMSYQHGESTAYLNHRVMDVRFYDTALVSRFFAVVDLTELKVQAAGEVL
jgi:hypothetical protein